jgi:hypothetical protein
MVRRFADTGLVAVGEGMERDGFAAGVFVGMLFSLLRPIPTYAPSHEELLRIAGIRLATGAADTLTRASGR